MNRVFAISLGAALICFAAWPAHAQGCEPAAVDMVFLVDNTNSMDRFVRDARTALPGLLSDFAEHFPDSQFGFSVVNDKDDSCLCGNAAAYCSRLEVPLTANTGTVKNGLANLQTPVGAWTSPEDILGGMLVAAHNTDWRVPKPNQNIVRAMVVVTDETYNQPGDLCNCKGPNYRPNDGDGDYDCANEDYPSVEQVRAVMAEKGIIPLFLTYDNREAHYQKLVERLNLGGLSKSMSAVGTSAVDVVDEAANELDCPAGAAAVGNVGLTVGVAVGAVALLAAGAWYFMKSPSTPPAMEVDDLGEGINTNADKEQVGDVDVATYA